MNFVDGEILHLDKPPGWTSFDVVKRVRSILLRRLGMKKLKVGHAGTLDPLATGVVIVTTGRSTRLIEQLQAGVKEYVATIAIGATTPSFDLETEIDAVFPAGHVTEEAVRAVLPQFTGRIEQVPPSYSAIKVDGHRAYNDARKGKEVELKPKVLVIDEIELLDFKPAGEAGIDISPDSDETLQSRLVRRHLSEQHRGLATATVRIVCSKGTYIRALARDIGQALGSGAHLVGLRRTRVGDVTADRCMTIEAVTKLLEDCPIEMPDDNKQP